MAISESRLGIASWLEKRSELILPLFFVAAVVGLGCPIAVLLTFLGK